MVSVKNYLNKAELDEYELARVLLRKYRRQAQDEQLRIRRLKDVARKRADKLNGGPNAR